LDWWEALVMLQSSTSDGIFSDTGFTDRQSGHLPLKKLRVESAELRAGTPVVLITLCILHSSSALKVVAGVGVAPTEAELMRLA